MINLHKVNSMSVIEEGGDDRQENEGREVEEAGRQSTNRDALAIFGVSRQDDPSHDIDQPKHHVDGFKAGRSHGGDDGPARVDRASQSP